LVLKNNGRTYIISIEFKLKTERRPTARYITELIPRPIKKHSYIVGKNTSKLIYQD
jgi:hypothetical protein